MRFIPFATISDMATIDLIMSLQQASLADGGLGGNDIPILSNNRLVFVESAFVVDEDAFVVGDTIAASATASEGLGGFDAAPLASTSGATVPEPPTLVVAIAALMLIVVFSRRTVA